MINAQSRISSMVKGSCWFVTIILFSAPLAKADCFETFNGVECNGLSSGARAGIGIAIAAGFLLLAFLFAFLRRRRISQQNQAFVVAAQQNPQAYQQGINSGLGAPGNFRAGSYQPSYYNGGTQYPPPTHTSYPGYDVQSGFAPPQGPPPPQYPGYAPPPGPPPPLGGRPGNGMNKDMP